MAFFLISLTSLYWELLFYIIYTLLYEMPGRVGPPLGILLLTIN